MKTPMVRPAAAGDAAAVARIYNHYVLNTIVSFEERALAAGDMAERMREIRGESLPWLVAERDGKIVGFAYAGKWKGRCAYRFAVESTVYVDRDALGRGHGTKLYGALLSALRARSLHVAIGGIALPNPASVALHEKLGFAKVAHFGQVGFKFGRWIDVGYWELYLQAR